MGVIVSQKGDVGIAYVSKNRETTWGVDLLKSLAKYLQEKNISAVFVDNDLLLDGYKVAGVSKTLLNDVAFFALHISINVDLDLIKNICTKEMVKIPKGLNDYGITTEEIKIFIEEFEENNKE